jgi:hypothetical protein
MNARLVIGSHATQSYYGSTASTAIWPFGYAIPFAPALQVTSSPVYLVEMASESNSFKSC